MSVETYPLAWIHRAAEDSEKERSRHPTAEEA
jgi:hypothetical protein